MNSCSKYERFSPTSNEASTNDEKNYTSGCNRCCSPWMIFASCMIVLSVLVLLLSIATAVIVILHYTQHKQVSTADGSGIMSNISATQDEFTGMYTNGTSALSIHCVTTAKAFRMEVMSVTGETVVTAFHSMSTNTTMVNINSTNFFIRKMSSIDSKYDDYIIPNESAMNMTLSMMNNEQEMNEENMNLLNKDGIKETRHSAIYSLAMSDEGKLIIEAAQVLGYNHNMHGIDYPVIMKFYILALRLSKIRNDSTVMFKSVNHTARKQVIREEQCEAYDTTCPSKALCPYRSAMYDNDCFGLCGYGCHCWTFVCGDCCIHQYCLTHDHCCAVRSFLSWDCLSAAWNKVVSDCEDVFDCS